VLHERLSLRLECGTLTPRRVALRERGQQHDDNAPFLGPQLMFGGMLSMGR
jgi:hypothetical protein